MLRTKNEENARRRLAWLVGARSLGATLSVAAMLALIAGCPGAPGGGPPAPTCTTAADCDNGDFCDGAETCTDGACVDGTAPCAADESCDEDTDACLATCATAADCDDADGCTDDVCNTNGVCENPFNTASCDDGDACTTGDVCADGACAGTAVICTNGETCNADTGECEGAAPACTDDADCDDGDDCTDNVCTNGVCVDSFNTNGCDDGDLCTEDDVCSGGTCAGTPVSCLPGEVCSNGVCIALAVSCTTNGDCDDGAFCNGVETCTDLITNGVCTNGTPPCAADETCDEDTDTCIAPAGQTLDLTPSNDTLTGGSGDDTFDGARDLEFGNLVITMNNGDILDGGTGTDTLNAQIDANTTPQSLAGIEIFNLEWLDNANAGTFSFTNADSVTTINNNNPQNAFTVNNIGTAPTHFGMTNSANDFTMTVDDQALTGTGDSCTLALSGVTDGGPNPVITIQPDAVGTSGYESITIDSAGSIDNSIDQLTDGNGNSFSTLNIMGDQGLTIDDALDGTVTTVNAANASGDLDLTFGAANHTITGGSGDDVFRMGGNFDANDTIDGGADSGNSDILESTDEDFTGTTSTQSNVSNIETIRTTEQIEGNLNVVHYGATNATIAGKDGTARTVTIPNGGTVEITGDIGANDLDIVLSGTDTTGDTLTVRLNGAGVTFTGNLDAGGFEQMALKSDGTGANTVVAPTLNAVGGVIETITLTGAQNLTLTGVMTAEKLDGATFTGVFDNSGGTVAGAVSITTGSGADLIDGSTGADVIDAGAGNDRIEGKAGSDMLTGGTGNDTYDFDGMALADSDTITDFDAGANNSTVDILAPDLSTINALIGVLSDTSNNAAAATDGTFVQLGSAGQTVANADLVGLIGDYTNAANALANEASWRIVFGGALDDNDAFMVAYTSGSNVRIALCEVNGASANSSTVDGMWDIAILTGVSLSNLDSGDYAITD